MEYILNMWNSYSWNDLWIIVPGTWFILTVEYQWDKLESRIAALEARGTGE